MNLTTKSGEQDNDNTNVPIFLFLSQNVTDKLFWAKFDFSPLSVTLFMRIMTPVIHKTLSPLMCDLVYEDNDTGDTQDTMSPLSATLFMRIMTPVIHKTLSFL
ncbi:hypothetical protein DPMN_109356 [Dreissena polymorpha]|uniref:Uncharacterized protein n=1 Tax=Dreissena polymorpha TaxID=45954 RepID=A0A9D4KA47_DREPO|nr:hypothetical protein DPMN_109356 [Dreissena polymorpha]